MRFLIFHRTPTLTVATIVFIAAATWLWIAKSTNTVLLAHTQATHTQATVAGFFPNVMTAKTLVAAVTPAAAQHAIAASLRGTLRDGRLRVDSSGHLIIERGLRDLFDYYLTTLGESDLGVIREQLLQVFHKELPQAAAVQAAQLLEAYLDYRQKTGALEQQYPDLNESNVADVVTEYFSARERLRQEIFDDETINAFFAADMANEQAALPVLEHMQSHNTTVAMNPNSSREGDGFAKYRDALRSSTEAGGMNAPARDTLRTELFGRDAAQRFVTLDQKRSDWAARVTQYRTEKKQLLSAEGLASSDIEVMLRQMQEAEFSATEILRIRALDRLEESGLLAP